MSLAIILLLNGVLGGVFLFLKKKDLDERNKMSKTVDAIAFNVINLNKRVERYEYVLIQMKDQIAIMNNFYEKPPVIEKPKGRKPETETQKERRKELRLLHGGASLCSGTRHTTKQLASRRTW